MSPRIGRPTKGDNPKNISLQLRISKDTDIQLKECAKILKMSRTEVIETGIAQIYRDLVENKK